jgi:hypothetical protein
VAEYLKRQFRELLGQLRKAGRGCVGVDTRGDIRSIILLYLAGCRRVVTLSILVHGTSVKPLMERFWRPRKHV